jgi:hypothetical protein
MQDLRTLVVRADWDAEAEVWVATSTDLPGLVTEAPDLIALQAKLEVMVPDLLEDGGEGFEDMPEIPMLLMSQQLSKIRLHS